MGNNILISGSIVIFKENLEVLNTTINCFLNIPYSKKLFLIDNTPNRFFEFVFNDERIEYIGVDENIGFGSAHNKILNHIKNKSKFHLILNPDVSFDEKVIPKLIEVLDTDKNITMIAPKVLFLNGDHQYSCRRYPSVLELTVRRFYFLNPLFKKIIYHGEYRERDLSKPFFAEYLTGCFQLYKTDDFITLNGFDERYFLYMEDVDICRKIDDLGKKKLYYPQVQIVHILKQGSLNNVNLFFSHLSSAIKYFLKWGF